MTQNNTQIMIDDFMSAMILLAYAIAQAGMATQYGGNMRLAAFGVAGFAGVCALILVIRCEET